MRASEPFASTCTVACRYLRDRCCSWLRGLGLHPIGYAHRSDESGEGQHAPDKGRGFHTVRRCPLATARRLSMARNQSRPELKNVTAPS
jgi:hypothetical protein